MRKRNNLIQMIDPHGAKLFEMFPLLLVHYTCSFSALQYNFSRFIL